MMIQIIFIILLSTNAVFGAKNEKTSATIIISNGNNGDNSSEEEEEPIVEEVPIPINIPFDVKASFIKTYLPLQSESHNIPNFYNMAQQSNHYPMIHHPPAINHHYYPINHNYPNPFISKIAARLPFFNTVKPSQHSSQPPIPLANLELNNHFHVQNRLLSSSTLPLYQALLANPNINDQNLKMAAHRYNSGYFNTNPVMSEFIANPYYHPLSILHYYNKFNNHLNNRFNMNTFNRVIPFLADHRKQHLNNPSLDQSYNHNNNRDLLLDIHGPPRNYPLRDSSSEQLSSDNPKSDDYEFLGEDEYPQGNSHTYKSNDPYYDHYSSHSPNSRYSNRNNRDEENYHDQRYFNRYSDDRDEDFSSEFRDRSFTTSNSNNGIRALFDSKDYNYNNDRYYGDEDVLDKILN